ncbi:MAG: hemolysin III family protein [Erysipelotrichaceae bacterium]|nr:hemolysin III family protein [Erysipelotrichaceae bacterium]MBQ1788143.1 hemolysin III family protein [Erysipelotrichaceae bacterium]
METAENSRHGIRIPDYTLGEELFNSISHGIAAAFSVAGLVLMIIRAKGGMAVTSVTLFGAAAIITYTISCIYHALSPSLSGKKVLRVIDHCNVYLLVTCTYIPAALLGVGGWLGWALFGLVCAVSVVGITLTAIDIDRFTVSAVLCHLLNGWSILFGLRRLLVTCGKTGTLILFLGGVAYSLGAAIYGIGRKRRYMHSVFHIFCMLGTFLHFWGIYKYLL